MIVPFSDTYFMQKALLQAKIAFEKGEIPIGALVVVNDTIIAQTHNLTEQLQDPTAHAEMIAFTSACNYLQSKYLSQATLYVTIEPCPMCIGASYWSKIGKIVYGSPDSHRGFLKQGTALHPKTKIVGGVLQEKCSELLIDFFKQKRQ